MSHLKGNPLVKGCRCGWQISWTRPRNNLTDFNSTGIQLSKNYLRGILARNILRSAFPNKKSIPTQTTKPQPPPSHPTHSGILLFFLQSCVPPRKARDGTIWQPHLGRWNGGTNYPTAGPQATDGWNNKSFSFSPSSRPDPLNSKPLWGTQHHCGCRLCAAL